MDAFCNRVLLALAVLLGGQAAADAAPQAGGKPNVIIFLADDTD